MSHRMKKVLAGVVGAAALAVGGSAIADAATSHSATTTTTITTPSTRQGAPQFSGPEHGTAAHEDAEKAVSGSDAARAQTAAVKAVGSGTAGAVTTDLPGTGYEVTVTKSDGSTVEVHLDSSFSMLQGPGGPGGPPPSAYHA